MEIANIALVIGLIALVLSAIAFVSTMKVWAYHGHGFGFRHGFGLGLGLGFGGGYEENYGGSVCPSGIIEQVDGQLVCAIT